MVRKFLKFSMLLFTFLLASSPSQAYSYSILVWGDSLSSAYGIAVEQGWVALLGDRLGERDIEIINGSIPGELSYGGLERIAQSLESANPDLVILALGSNDGLQGLDIEHIRKNLEKIILSAQKAGSDVLLLGMKIPPNYGKRYAEEFHSIYIALASRFNIRLVPFFLEPVALDFSLMQADGYHPTASAQPLLLDHIWPAVFSFLSEAN